MVKKQNGKNVYRRLNTFSGTLSTFVFITIVLVFYSVFAYAQSGKICGFDQPRQRKSISGTISACDRCGAVFPTNTMQIAATTHGQFALVCTTAVVIDFYFTGSRTATGRRRSQSPRSAPHRRVANSPKTHASPPPPRDNDNLYHKSVRAVAAGQSPLLILV